MGEEHNNKNEETPKIIKYIKWFLNPKNLKENWGIILIAAIIISLILIYQLIINPLLESNKEVLEEIPNSKVEKLKKDVPEEITNWKVEELKKIDLLIESMTEKDKLGQLLMIGLYAKGSDGYKSNIKVFKELIEKYRIGNIILYHYNFPSTLSIKDDFEIPKYIAYLTNELQKISYNSQNIKIPLFISTDQEGSINQIRRGVTLIPSHVFIGASRSEKIACEAGKVIGQECSALGINMVLAPVADINNNDENDIIGRRAFGAHKDIVSPLCVKFMQGLKKGGVLSIAKHFPGHGNSKDDPHFTLAKIGYEDLSQLRDNDMVPFENLIKKKVDGILTSHIMAPPLDRDYPVTISEKIIKGELRSKMRFKGLVITDDITAMVGILKDETGKIVHERHDIALNAYKAGHDIVIFGQISMEEDQKYPERTVTSEEFKKYYDKILEYFTNNRNEKENIKSSLKRILLKKAIVFGGSNNFNDLKKWKVNFDLNEYKKMVKHNKNLADKIIKESVVLISEEGKIIEDVQNSKYFSSNVGPLSKEYILKSGDKICLVSPVFEKPDRLYQAISKYWIPKSNIVLCHLIYGWRAPKWRKYAEKIWGEPVYRFSYSDSFGDPVFIEGNINRKINEINRKCRNCKVLVFGAREREHIKILEGVCRDKRNNGILFLILLFKEPYFLSKDIYKKDNTIVIYSSSQESYDVITKILFGKYSPKGVSYLPISIPSLVHRQIVSGKKIEKYKLSN